MLLYRGGGGGGVITGMFCYQTDGPNPVGF